jgi:hypothetical protein
MGWLVVVFMTFEAELKEIRNLFVELNKKFKG